VRRGKVPKSGSKITICHIPPGNHANIHSMTISTNAWTTHQHHGDYLGYCHGRPTQIVTQKCIDTPTPTPTPTPPPDETPTPAMVCGVAGPYLNLACTETRSLSVGATLQNGRLALEHRLP
jgi:hypothetical protein